MALLKITKASGTQVNLPDPSMINWEEIEVLGSGTGTNQVGDGFKDVVNHKISLQVGWPALTQTNISTILNAITDTYFDITYIDPKNGTVTKTFGVESKSVPMLFIKNNTAYWSGLSIIFQER